MTEAKKPMSTAANNVLPEGRVREIHVNHRPIPIGSGQKTFERFLGEMKEKLDDPSVERNRLCRDVLYDLYYGESGRPYEDLLADPKTPLATKAALESLDPRNVTLEPEQYSELEPEKFYKVKPLTWLWLMYDRSPLGMNLHLGLQFRRLLAKKVFKHCGENVKIFHNVEYSFGHNITCGDGVVIHRYVLLDDRGEIILGDKASLSDFVNVYSHWHHVEDPQHVFMNKTVIGAGARVTYHSTVLSGVRVGDDAMLGAHGLAHKDVPDHTVAVGIPAKPVKVKPWPR